jgi:hypothetical protein
MRHTIYLYPFKFRDSLTGKWVHARYVAERRVLEERYREFEIIGPPEAREIPDDALEQSAAHVARGAVKRD